MATSYLTFTSPTSWPRESATHKLQQLNHHPNLIHFIPLEIPHLQGLPQGAETASDVPFPLHDLLCTAYDQTRDQVETLVATLRPDLVFTDLSYWVPSLGTTLKLNTVFYSALALGISPTNKFTKDMTIEDLTEPPQGFPSQKMRFEPNEVGVAQLFITDFGSGLSFHKRLMRLTDCDVIAVRTCLEIERPFCEYIAEHYKKPMFLTGSALPEAPVNELEEKWTRWLGIIEEGSVVFCALGSQVILQKDQFQELLLGLESSDHPFLVALSPPEGSKTVEEALPEVFKERVQGRGWVYGRWVPQAGLLDHPSVGCFGSQCGFESMWESLVSDCQIVLVPFLFYHIINARLLAEELQVAVEVERSGENRWISEESLSRAIESVMDRDGELARLLKCNHDRLTKILSRERIQEEYVDVFIQNLQHIMHNDK